MFFFIFAFLFPKQAPYKIAIISIGLCFAIEISQLYQADWIKNLRNSTLGKWTLGKGFLWSDLVCYTLGGMFGVLFEKIVVDYRER